jgi:hypothetical protein
MVGECRLLAHRAIAPQSSTSVAFGGKRTLNDGQDRLAQSRMTRMYGPAAFRKRDCAWVAEVADMYPACLIGSRAVALMGIRTHRWSH